MNKMTKMTKMTKMNKMVQMRKMNVVYPEGGVECVLFAVHIESEKLILGSRVGYARM